LILLIKRIKSHKRASINSKHFSGGNTRTPVNRGKKRRRVRVEDEGYMTERRGDETRKKGEEKREGGWEGRKEAHPRFSPTLPV
jgi:hypothetical protein